MLLVLGHCRIIAALRPSSHNFLKNAHEVSKLTLTMGRGGTELVRRLWTLTLKELGTADPKWLLVEIGVM